MTNNLGQFNSYLNFYKVIIFWWTCTIDIPCVCRSLELFSSIHNASATNFLLKKINMYSFKLIEIRLIENNTI